MTILDQEIVEHLRKLDDAQKGRVLAFIQSIEETETPNPDVTWTPEEIEEMMESYRNPTPKTGAEIVEMVRTWDPSPWAHIQDGAEWVAEQRRKNAEESQW